MRGSCKRCARALADSERPVYLEFQVDVPAHASGDDLLFPYPPEFERERVEGDVLVQLVVDTTGRAETGSFKVLASSSDAFTKAMRHALPGLRFTPAKRGGRKVRQLVQMPYRWGVRQ